MKQNSPAAAPAKSLAHRLAADIRRDIISGYFAPGTRLKTEVLTERYAVSASPVREALWRLEGEGFIVLLPNQGASVRVVDDDFVRNIFEIRSVIEPLFVGRFCRRCSSADIDRLKEAAEKFRQAGTHPIDTDAMDRHNRDFHAIMIEEEPNEEGIQVIERYGDLINAVRSQHRMTEGRARMRIVEHAAIIEAIAKGDVELARQASRDHVLAAGEDFLEQMRQSRRKIHKLNR
ncbi:hypothetical protein ACMU_17140 [Actibacterium mucosum KCTC 23349]|uniref:HTH gntR-type domain-containing protein n=1 Tax=Actibacterium mucosum KCTC 23349 TaxID=1454373 RepID=A0A037ZFS1_9RHOB|nr:GntR family transcriptional regulator [Actibacterium mucosum]KAJ54438.1 hypothetical protein ACMU_17140 [Actibacterium mucosum KCTC 23349]